MTVALRVLYTSGAPEVGAVDRGAGSFVEHSHIARGASSAGEATASREGTTSHPARSRVETPEEDRPHVLVVEDEAHLARLLGELLAPLAVRVTCVRDGAGALEHIRADPTLRLVLLDVMLPGMDGLDVLRAAREERDGGDLPVIVLTGRGEADLRDRALELGATDLFTKPFSPRALVGRVREICRT